MEFQPYMIVQGVFFIIMLVFFFNEYKSIGQHYNNKNDKLTLYLTLIIIFIGVIVRSINLSHLKGVNIDEAFQGYDMWCLANFGYDQNLQSFPVYLESWGGGMSALYTYISLPLVKIFGLSVEVIRLPMSIIGCFSLLFFYWTLRKTNQNTLLILCFCAFLAISPWHIMKSRFSMDAILSSEIMLYSICFLILAYFEGSSRKRITYYTFGCLFMVLTAYSYAISWTVLPFFLLLTSLYLYKTGKIKKQYILINSIIITIGVLPLLYFCGILFFDFPPVKVGPFTITGLSYPRTNNSIALFLNDNLAIAIFQSLLSKAKILLLGTDGVSIETSMPFFGIFYNIISLPFLVYGIIEAYKDRKPVVIIISIALISSIMTITIGSTGVVNWTLIWIPLIFLTANGIYYFASKYKECRPLFFSMYAIILGLFLSIYFGNKTSTSIQSYMIENEVKFAQNLNLKKIYYPHDISPCIVLFYNPTDPKTTQSYLITDINKNINKNKNINSIIIQGLPPEIIPQLGNGYVISNDMIPHINKDSFNIKYGKYYSVLWNK